MRIRSLFISVSLVLASFAFSAILEAQSPASLARGPGSLALAGGRGPMDIARSAARKITETNPQITFRISDSGGNEALDQLSAGLVQIAGLSRPLEEAEISEEGLVGVPVAREGVVVVVNMGNPVSGITQSQLQGVLSGRIANWRELGGRNRPIRLYVLPPGSSARQIIEETVLEETPISPSARVMGASPNIKDALGEDPDGLGFINLSNFDILVKGLAYEGVVPSLDNSAYRLNRSLYLVTKGPARGLAGDFIGFIRSPEGETPIREAGFSPGGR
ncbi:MAG: substrate-binding domain-containing protein [Candidatus Adiutrix sp.]|jgi:phosphate transport system substrate-binding protein|nr:substrate-binding domain-containing protein [Candidatus Adiutrix sp.]